MSCATCKEECKWNVIYTCRVCELVDGDSNEKRVCYCEDCAAYICQNCWPDLIRRGIAFAKTSLAKTVEVIQNFVDTKKRKKKNHQTDEFGKEDEIKK